jgi:hypothetical protein
MDTFSEQPDAWAAPRTTETIASVGTTKLSVVVVFFEMRREAVRTLYTLSPSYQRGIAADDYEVIAIDNGSIRAPLDIDLFEGPSARVRYHYCKPSAPSPIAAINFGVSLARFENIVVMIDGARMISPGMLAYLAKALHLFPEAFAYSLSMHLGSKPQGSAMLEGYDQCAEDALLESVDWRNDGYRLFEISCLAPSAGRGFLHPISESNCFAMKRSHYARIGGLDERFVSPGGGLANLDFFNRALVAPWLKPVRILGEASFHQFHNGVAANAPPERHPFPVFAAEYESIRGQPYRSAFAPSLFFGHVPERCARFMSTHNA